MYGTGISRLTGFCYKSGFYIKLLSGLILMMTITRLKWTLILLTC